MVTQIKLPEHSDGPEGREGRAEDTAALGNLITVDHRKTFLIEM